MDETSAARGHDYITLFVDLETKKTVFVTDGKSNETVKDFSIYLQKHNAKPKQIKQVSCDRILKQGPAFIIAVRETLPAA